VILAVSPCAAFALLSSPVTGLAPSDSYKQAFASDGMYIVYDSLASDTDVYGRIGICDMAQKTETIVSGDARNPDVANGTVVYEANRTDEEGGLSSQGIYAWDIATGTESVVASAPFGQYEQPRIDGHIVVYSGWEDHTQIGVRGVDLLTGRVFTVTRNPNAYAADISNGWVVYCVLRPSVVFPDWYNALQGDIRAYEIATGRTYTLCDDIHDQRNPRIGSSGIVVWDDERNSGDYFNESDHSETDVYGCSVYNCTNFPVAKRPGCQSMASVDGNLVAYCDSTTPGGYGTMGFDVLSGTQFGLAPGSVSGSGLSGGIVVWGETRPVADGSDEDVTDLYFMQPALLDTADDSDVYSNAVSSSQDMFPDGADSVVVASATSWTDELIAASLVDADGPLLVVKPDAMPAVTAAELRRLGAISATILGTTGSVSSHVQAEIDAILADNLARRTAALGATASTHGVVQAESVAYGLHRRVMRVSGSRYALADKVASKAAARPGWDGTVMIVSGTRSTEAMAAIPLIAARSLPVILSAPRGLSSAETALLKSRRVRRVVIVGGPTVVSDRVFTQASHVVGSRNVVRLAGKDAYATAAAVASYGVNRYKLTWNGLGIATAGSFSSALTGGLRCAKNGSVLLLTDGKRLSASASSALRSNGAAIRRATYVGSRSISKRVRGQVRLILR
jgi:putative cell wall-binding protein